MIPHNLKSPTSQGNKFGFTQGAIDPEVMRVGRFTRPTGLAFAGNFTLLDWLSKSQRALTLALDITC